MMLKLRKLFSHIPSIDGRILVCSNCRKSYNIVRPELDIYKSENILIPRLCPSCRYARRIALRLPRKLWKGKCRCGGARSENGEYANTTAHIHGDNPCPNEFETSYSPDRPDTVYCENYYNSEII